MPDFSFRVTDARITRDALTPTIALALSIRNQIAGERIQNIILRAQIHIETPRREYSSGEEIRLRDLFGEPARWEQTLRPILWTNASTIVPAFEIETSASLPIPCTIDLSAAFSKYFFGLEGGTAPIMLMFSGTAFYVSNERLQAFPIPWSSETRFAFPVALWKDCMDLHYPNAAWLGIRRDVFERLYRFKVEHGLATLDDAIELALGNAMAAQA